MFYLLTYLLQTMWKSGQLTFLSSVWW